MLYAVSLSLNDAVLQELYVGGHWQNAYAELAQTLSDCGFGRRQGSIYFGSRDISAVQCVLAVQRLTRQYPWFNPSVTEIQMLRIEEISNLSPALHC